MLKLGGRHLGIHNMNIAELCNGSTYDSDSYCLGSNPSSAATSQQTLLHKSPRKTPGALTFVSSLHLFRKNRLLTLAVRLYRKESDCFPPFFPWQEVTIHKKAPYSITAQNCYASETELRGSVAITPEEAIAHPEWMCDSGFVCYLITTQLAKKTSRYPPQIGSFH